MTQENFFKNTPQPANGSQNEPRELTKNVEQLRKKLGWLNGRKVSAEEQALIRQHCVETLNIIYATRESILKNEASLFLDKTMKERM